MGLFDSFYDNIVCPYCQHEYEAEVQTKQLENMLAEFRKGDEVRFDLRGAIKNNYVVASGCLEGIDICPECKQTLCCKIHIHSGKFAGLEIDPRTFYMMS